MFGALKRMFKTTPFLGSSDQRRHQRVRCDEPAEFINENGQKCACKILDKSMSGLRIQSPVKLRVSQNVGFVYPSFEAKVVWAKGNTAGLRFQMA